MPPASRSSRLAPLTPYPSTDSLQGMMGMKGRIGDRFITALAVWIVVLGAIFPTLDRVLLGSELAIESEHNETCAHPRHDHAICLQFGKQRWSKSSSISLQEFPPVAGESVSLRHDAPVEVLRRIPTRARAPPHTT